MDDYILRPMEGRLYVEIKTVDVLVSICRILTLVHGSKLDVSSIGGAVQPFEQILCAVARCLYRPFGPLCPLSAL